MGKTCAQNKVNITKEELANIKSLGDVVDLTDVHEIYTSLISYLHLVYQQKEWIQKAQIEFLHKDFKPAPFIIGISGSVAVGKSTTARLLQLLLKRTYPDLKVHLMTTDGFLYPNEELKRRDLMPRKGFPESYNMTMLSDFLSDVLSGKKTSCIHCIHRNWATLSLENMVMWRILMFWLSKASTLCSCRKAAKS